MKKEIKKLSMIVENNNDKIYDRTEDLTSALEWIDVSADNIQWKTKIDDFQNIKEFGDIYEASQDIIKVVAKIEKLKSKIVDKTRVINKSLVLINNGKYTNLQDYINSQGKKIKAL